MPSWSSNAAVGLVTEAPPRVRQAVGSSRRTRRRKPASLAIDLRPSASLLPRFTPPSASHNFSRMTVYPVALGWMLSVWKMSRQIIPSKAKQAPA
jgi:hypothetical protein